MGWLTMDELAGFLGKTWFGPGSGPKPRPAPAPRRDEGGDPRDTPPPPPRPSRVPYTDPRSRRRRRKEPVYDTSNFLRAHREAQQRRQKKEPVYDTSSFLRAHREAQQRRQHALHRASRPRAVAQAPRPGSWEWHHARTDYAAIQDAARARGAPSGGGGYAPSSAFAMQA